MNKQDETAGDNDKRQIVKTRFIMKPKKYSWPFSMHVSGVEKGLANTPKRSFVLSFELSLNSYFLFFYNYCLNC